MYIQLSIQNWKANIKKNCIPFPLNFFFFWVKHGIKLKICFAWKVFANSISGNWPITVQDPHFWCSLYSRRLCAQVMQWLQEILDMHLCMESYDTERETELETHWERDHPQRRELILHLKNPFGRNWKKLIKCYKNFCHLTKKI